MVKNTDDDFTSEEKKKLKELYNTDDGSEVMIMIMESLIKWCKKCNAMMLELESPNDGVCNISELKLIIINDMFGRSIKEYEKLRPKEYKTARQAVNDFYTLIEAKLSPANGKIKDEIRRQLYENK